MVMIMPVASSRSTTVTYDFDCTTDHGDEFTASITLPNGTSLSKAVHMLKGSKIVKVEESDDACAPCGAAIATLLWSIFCLLGFLVVGLFAGAFLDTDLVMSPAAPVWVIRAWFCGLPFAAFIGWRAG